MVSVMMCLAGLKNQNTKTTYHQLVIPIFVNNPMKTAPKRICGAQNRQGLPCKRPPLAGKNRCLLHGGKTPAKQNAGVSNGNSKHGLYSAYLSPEEAQQWDNIPLGDVDAEIRMCKVWLKRSMALEATLKPANADGTEMSEIRQSFASDDGATRTDVVSKRPDVSARQDRLLGRIAQLEKTRAELIAAAQANTDSPGDKALEVAVALRAMIRTEQAEDE